MGSTVANDVSERPRKMLAMRALRGEGDRKPLALAEFCRVIGRSIERALVAAGIEKKAAASSMGYADQSALSRWIAGIETANFAKLWSLGADFQRELVIALAAECAVIRIDTVLTANDRRRA